MFTDPFYGLNNPQNYPRWQALQNTNRNTTALYKKLAWQAEIRSYFGLTSAQVQEITNNWNGLWLTTQFSLELDIPSPQQYQN
jgi:hypothetical protein